MSGSAAVPSVAVPSQLHAMAMAMAAAQSGQSMWANTPQLQGRGDRAPRVVDLGQPGPRVFVGGIHEHTTVHQLDNVFSACGEIRDIVLVSRKGIAFIEFETVESAAEAVKYNGWLCNLIPSQSDIKSPATLSVKYAKPREQDYRPQHDEKQSADATAPGAAGSLDDEAAGPDLAKGDGGAAPPDGQRKRDRSQSPEVRPPFGKRVAHDVNEDLKAGSVNYGLALGVLHHWLKTGECNKETRDTIHGLLKATSSGLESRLAVNGAVKESAEQFLREATLCEAVMAEANTPKVNNILTKEQRSINKANRFRVTENKKLVQKMLEENFAGGAAGSESKEEKEEEEMDMGEEDSLKLPVSEKDADALKQEAMKLSKRLASLKNAAAKKPDAAALRKELDLIKEMAAKVRTLATSTPTCTRQQFDTNFPCRQRWRQASSSMLPRPEPHRWIQGQPETRFDSRIVLAHPKRSPFCQRSAMRSMR